MVLLLSFQTESDKEKFEYIYEHYKKLLLHKAYGILHSYPLAEDAVSEAFIRIYKNIHKIEDPKSNQTISFVVTIAKNTALTMLEKEKKYTSQEIEQSVPDHFDLERYVLAEIAADQIYQVMEQVGEELKSVFLLKYAHGYSHKEVAAVLGISENNVTVRLHRAKKKIAKILEKEGYRDGQ